MKPLTDTGAAFEAVRSAHCDLMEHSTSPAFREFGRWLDAHVAYLQAEMMQANQTDLIRKQVEAQAIARLREELKPTKF